MDLLVLPSLNPLVSYCLKSTFLFHCHKNNAPTTKTQYCQYHQSLFDLGKTVC